jgi:hypothetical protein
MSWNNDEDGFKVKYRKLAMEFEVLRRIVSQDLERHMQALLHPLQQKQGSIR